MNAIGPKRAPHVPHVTRASLQWNRVDKAPLHSNLNRFACRTENGPSDAIVEVPLNLSRADQTRPSFRCGVGAGCRTPVE
jgi:hypothetical protein